MRKYLTFVLIIGIACIPLYAQRGQQLLITQKISGGGSPPSYGATLCTSISQTGTSISCMYTGTVAAGVALVMMSAGEPAAADTVVSAGDGTNTFTEIANSPQQATIYETHILVKCNASSVVNPTFTLQVTQSNSFFDMSISRIDNASTGTCVGATSGTTGLISVPDPGAGSLSTGNYVILETCAQSGTVTLGTGFTSISVVDEGLQYKVVSAGTWGASAFATSNNAWVANGVAIQ